MVVVLVFCLATDLFVNAADTNAIVYTFSLMCSPYNECNSDICYGRFRVLSGKPVYQGVLINSDDIKNAVWTKYDGKILLNFAGQPDGEFSVLFRLKGDAPDSRFADWIGTTIKLKRAKPINATTNAATPAADLVVNSAANAKSVGSAPVINRHFSNSTNGSVTMIFLTSPNTSSRIYATTNLMPPIFWQAIYTNISGTNGIMEFTDTNASLFPVRFYLISTP